MKKNKNYALLVLRIKAGMTQTEVAQALNVQQSTVTRWETVGTPPPRKYHEMLCRLYDCTMDDLKGAIA